MSDGMAGRGKFEKAGVIPEGERTPASCFEEGSDRGGLGHASPIAQELWI